MIVQVCDHRIRLQELIHEVESNQVKWPALSAVLEQAKAAVENVERKLARAAQRDFPEMELPRICINRGEP